MQTTGPRKGLCFTYRVLKKSSALHLYAAVL